MEQLDYNLLFRWFVGLAMDAPIWDVDGVHQEPRPVPGGRGRREVLPGGAGPARGQGAAVGRAFLGRWHLDRGVCEHEELQAEGRRLATDRAAGGGRNAERDFHGEKRTNDTHASTTDPDARLYRKGRGKEAKLCHMGHLLMENRNGLIVDAMLTPGHRHGRARGGRGHAGSPAGPASRHARRRQGLRYGGLRRRSARAERHPARRPEHVRPALGDRRSDHAPSRLRRRASGCASGSRRRFGWIKTVGGLRKTRHRGTARVGWLFTLTATACNLVRLPKLLAAG